MPLPLSRLEFSCVTNVTHKFTLSMHVENIILYFGSDATECNVELTIDTDQVVYSGKLFLHSSDDRLLGINSH